jgi:2-keto-3-deoxy-L-rhamnonate aldolase RhmA
MMTSFFGKTITAILLAAAVSLPATAQQATPGAGRAKLYNTAKQKLLDGKSISCYTVSRPDPDLYCKVAPHYDYVWFDMQHSTLSFADIEKMIGTCPKAGIPMIRLSDEFESTIQHALDVGALGVIEPTVDTVEKAMTFAKYAKFPMEGRRSNGQSQASRLYGSDYRQTANDNILVVVMIETPVGVANAYDIARVPGVDVVLVANNDLGSFSGTKPGEPAYEELITKVKLATLKAGKIFGAASFEATATRPDKADFRMFQNGPSIDGWQLPVAPAAKK